MNKIVQYNLSIDLAEVTKAAVGAPEFLALPSSVKAKLGDIPQNGRKRKRRQKSALGGAGSFREVWNNAKQGEAPFQGGARFKRALDGLYRHAAFFGFMAEEKGANKASKGFLGLLARALHGKPAVQQAGMDEAFEGLGEMAHGSRRAYSRIRHAADKLWQRQLS